MPAMQSRIAGFTLCSHTPPPPAGAGHWLLLFGVEQQKDYAKLVGRGLRPVEEAGVHGVCRRPGVASELETRAKAVEAACSKDYLERHLERQQPVRYSGCILGDAGELTHPLIRARDEWRVTCIGRPQVLPVHSDVQQCILDTPYLRKEALVNPLLSNKTI